MSFPLNQQAEWLEADGLGGFASGTVAGIRTRRYHALLLVATTPPTGRVLLVNGLDAWVETAAGSFPISSQVYTPEVVHPDGARRMEAFQRRFWNEAGGYLYDVVDPDHRAGTADATFRPNQIFAVGGLPVALLDGDRARRVVEAVEARLWTPLGLRSLAPGESGYAPRCEGGVRERDGAYHQGTVWPWLIGPFVEAWVRVRGGTPEAKWEARSRYLAPLFRHLIEAGLGHLSEIADGDPPHTPRGCPFQVWSMGELLRLALVVLAGDEENPSGSIVAPRDGSSPRISPGIDLQLELTPCRHLKLTPLTG